MLALHFHRGYGWRLIVFLPENLLSCSWNFIKSSPATSSLQKPGPSTCATTINIKPFTIFTDGSYHDLLGVFYERVTARAEYVLRLRTNSWKKNPGPKYWKPTRWSWRVREVYYTILCLHEQHGISTRNMHHNSRCMSSDCIQWEASIF